MVRLVVGIAERRRCWAPIVLRRCQAQHGARSQRFATYEDLLRIHIEKEEQVLFPMAEELVPPDAAADLVARFDAIERERVGEGKHEEYHAMLDRLKAIYGS